jgi:hypothetical protein
VACDPPQEKNALHFSLVSIHLIMLPKAWSLLTSSAGYTAEFFTLLTLFANAVSFPQTQPHIFLILQGVMDAPGDGGEESTLQPFTPACFAFLVSGTMELFQTQALESSVRIGPGLQGW